MDQPTTQIMQNQNSSKKISMTKNGVVDSHMVNKVQPVVSLQGPVESFVPNKNHSQDNSATSMNANAAHSSNPIPPRINANRRNYTPLGEPIELALKKLIQTYMITLPEVKPYEPSPFKPST